MGIVNREYLERASRDSLIVNDKKHRGYMISIVNETVLDRTYALQFEIDGKEFKSIAHYLFYAKCTAFRLPNEVTDDIYTHYKAVFPVKPSMDILPYEDAMLERYADEFQNVASYLKAEWRDNCVSVAADCVFAVAKQDKSFASALKETKNSVIVESSKSITWGIDCESALISELAHPETWSGNNYYGQALTAARDYYTSFARKVKGMLSQRKV